MMKAIFKFLPVVVASVLFTACGGGDDGDDNNEPAASPAENTSQENSTPNPTSNPTDTNTSTPTSDQPKVAATNMVYDGATDAATFTITNYARMLMLALDNGQSAVSYINEATNLNLQRAALSVTADTAMRTAKSVARSYTPQAASTEDCLSGGTLTINSNLSLFTFTGKLTLDFANCNTNEIILDGMIEVDVRKFNIQRQFPTSSFITLHDVRQTELTTGIDTTSGGTIDAVIDLALNQETLVVNTLHLENNTGMMWLLKDNEIVNVYDHIDFPRPMTQTRVGRIYEQTVGYFDVQTQTPLNYFSNFTFYPQSGGPIILTGADNTKIRATSESFNMVTVELDLDADGTYETPITESWEDISRKAIASSLLAN